MILNHIIRIQRIWTVLIFSRLITNLIVGHIGIKPYLIGTMFIILCQEWNMGHDISVMDHSSNFLYFLSQVLDEIGVSDSRWSECVQLWYSSVKHLELYCGNGGMCGTKTWAGGNDLGCGELFSKVLDCAIKLKTDWYIWSVEPSMDKTPFTSWIIHLGIRKVLNPVFNIFSASKHHNDTIERTMISYKSHNISNIIL